MNLNVLNKLFHISFVDESKIKDFLLNVYVCLVFFGFAWILKLFKSCFHLAKSSTSAGRQCLILLIIILTEKLQNEFKILVKKENHRTSSFWSYFLTFNSQNQQISLKPRFLWAVRSGLEWSRWAFPFKVYGGESMEVIQRLIFYLALPAMKKTAAFFCRSDLQPIK